MKNKYVLIFDEGKETGEMFTPDPQLSRNVEYHEGDSVVFEGEVGEWEVVKIEHVFKRLSPRLIQTNVYLKRVK